MWWLPALTTTTLTGLALWLTKSLIITRLTASVKGEFDGKLELLRAELRGKESQIESLRSVAMSGLTTRQGVLYQRKIKAIDDLWHSVNELEKVKHVSASLATLNFENCAKESPTNPNLRSLIEGIGGSFDIKTLDLSGAKRAKPFVTPLAWAYYSAYSSVIIQAVVVMKVLRIGVDDAEKYLNLKSTSSLLKTVLPHMAGYIDEFGVSGHHHLLDQIEQLLLQELQDILNGREDDTNNTKRAAEIGREVEEVSRNIEKMAGNN